MDVDERLLSELEAMGFPRDQAKKALHFAKSNIEEAINWIVDHENDISAREMPLKPKFPVNVNIEESESFQISERVKLRAQELRNQARKRRADQVKQLEMEREKQRIRAGKELMEAKRMAEDTERTRFLDQRKADKEEQRKARDKVLQKLLQDKLERKGMLGLPREGPPSVQPTIALSKENNVHNLSSFNPDVLPSKPASEKELMRECLRAIQHRNKDEDAKAIRAFQTLMIYVRNVVNNPDNGKYRKIRISNPIFQERVGKFEEGIKFLELCGFERAEGGSLLFLPQENVDMHVLMLAGAELQNALTNPFFGRLSR